MKNTFILLCLVLLTACTDKPSSKNETASQISCSGQVEVTSIGLDKNIYEYINSLALNQPIVKKFTLGKDYLVLRSADGSTDSEQRFEMCNQSPTVNTYSSDCKSWYTKDQILSGWLLLNDDPERKAKNEIFIKQNLLKDQNLRLSFFYLDRTDLDLVMEVFLLNDVFYETIGKKNSNLRVIDKNFYKQDDGRFKCLMQSVKI